MPHSRRLTLAPQARLKGRLESPHECPSVARAGPIRRALPASATSTLHHAVACRPEPQVRSMGELYPSLMLHEREMVDLFGVQVSGLPEGPRYPLPDCWPEGEYPLRKEWNPAYFNKQTVTYEPPKEEDAK